MDLTEDEFLQEFMFDLFMSQETLPAEFEEAIRENILDLYEN